MYYIQKHTYSFTEKINSKNYNKAKRLAYESATSQIICHSVSINRAKDYFYKHYNNDCFKKNVFTFYSVSDENHNLIFSDDYMFL